VTYAFIAFYMALVFGRTVWLAEPFSIPLHRLQNGALLLFTFFMISDPRTTPNSRLGRIVFAFLAASGAWYIQFRLFRTNGPLWSLALCSLTVPLLDRLLPAKRFEWKRSTEQFSEVVYETRCVDAHRVDDRDHLEEHRSSVVLRLLRRQGRYQTI
jgi:Na+-translocating ferredoxin:NAD+ oxidoreductase RnfD subunit